MPHQMLAKVVSLIPAIPIFRLAAAIFLRGTEFLAQCCNSHILRQSVTAFAKATYVNSPHDLRLNH
jgi:hypothetical protein